MNDFFGCIKSQKMILPSVANKSKGNSIPNIPIGQYFAGLQKGAKLLIKRKSVPMTLITKIIFRDIFLKFFLKGLYLNYFCAQIKCFCIFM